MSVVRVLCWRSDILAPFLQVVVGIHFRTSPDSSALQWLPPSQTAEKRHPYLFSQCQAIHARALVPCQDSPSRKMSYNAAVRVPEALRPLMSAVPIDDPSDEAGTVDICWGLLWNIPVVSNGLLWLQSALWAQFVCAWEQRQLQWGATSRYLVWISFLCVQFDLGSIYLW